MIASSGTEIPSVDCDGNRGLTDGVDGPKWMFWRRQRYTVAFLAFLGFFNIMAMRVNVSVAVVAMTSPIKQLGNWTVSLEPEFSWDSKMKGLILSSYFYGYITTQILGGWAASRIGGNRIFGFGIALTAIFTLATPFLVRINVYWFIAIRVIIGVCEGGSYPSMHEMWSHWAPVLERNRLATAGYSGACFGIVVGMLLSGVLAERFGWPSVFYVFGIPALIWFLFWCACVHRSPETDKSIKPQELKYIQEGLGVDFNKNKNISHPWSRFFHSMPVWAIIVANFTENWGLHTLLTEMPLFMKDAHNLDIQASSILSALPYIMIGFTLPSAGQLADWIINKKVLTITQVRKLFCCSAFMGQALFLLLPAFIMSSAGAVACLTIGVGLGGFSATAFLMNHLDLAPQHASVLMGIANTAGTLPGIISPTLTGYLITSKGLSEWAVVFYISCGVYVCGAIFYAILASGERQCWAINENDLASVDKSNKEVTSL